MCGWKCTVIRLERCSTIHSKKSDPLSHTHNPTHAPSLSLFAWTLRPPGRFTDAIKQTENISHFLESASSFGLPLEDCFQVDDLRLDDDMARVVLSLSALKSLAEN